MKSDIRLVSPHAPIPLAKILKAEMDRKWTENEKRDGRVMGQGTEEKMFLRLAKWNSRTGAVQGLTATMVAHGEGTLIVGAFGLPENSGCVINGCIAFVMIQLVFVGFAFSALDFPLLAILFLTGPLLAMAVAGIAFRIRMTRGGPEAERRILDFLAETVDAIPEEQLK